VWWQTRALTVDISRAENPPSRRRDRPPRRLRGRIDVIRFDPRLTAAEQRAAKLG
jgi:hypothetical protein